MLLATILAVLLLVGCVPPEGAEACNAPYTQIGDKCCMDLNNNGICDSDEEPFQPEGPVAKDAVMQGFIDTLAATGGYTYKYEEDTYRVSGDIVKREMVEQKKIKADAPVGPKKVTMVWIDSVYFSTAEKKANAFCEGLSDRGQRMCSGYGLWDIEIPVLYDEFYIKTPTDWLMDFADKTVSNVEENYRFEIPGLEVTGVTFVLEDRTVKLDVDPKTGIVWKATVDEDGFVTEMNYAGFETGTGDVAHEYKSAPEKPDFYPDEPRGLTEGADIVGDVDVDSGVVE
jgi:hypothetical protein